MNAQKLDSQNQQERTAHRSYIGVRTLHQQLWTEIQNTWFLVKYSPASLEPLLGTNQTVEYVQTSKDTVQNQWLSIKNRKLLSMAPPHLNTNRMVNYRFILSVGHKALMLLQEPVGSPARMTTLTKSAK